MPKLFFSGCSPARRDNYLADDPDARARYEQALDDLRDIRRAWEREGDDADRSSLLFLAPADELPPVVNERRFASSGASWPDVVDVLAAAGSRDNGGGDESED